MYNAIHKINAGLVILCTLIAITLYGLILLPLLGAYQMIVSIVLFFKKHEIPKHIFFHIIIHFSIALLVLSGFWLIKYIPLYRGNFFPLLIPSGLLAYYHLWITHQLNENINNKDILTS